MDYTQKNPPGGLPDGPKLLCCLQLLAIAEEGLEPPTRGL